MMLQLNIGSGLVKKTEDWVRVDAYTECDVKALMWDLPYQDETVDAIVSRHALEHVPFAMVDKTLHEWRRVLKINRSALIEVPDLSYAAQYWLDHPGDKWALDILFGNQAHEGEFHKTGWSYNTFREVLQRAEFREIAISSIWSHNQESLEAVVTK